jgi:hypothetical protein
LIDNGGEWGAKFEVMCRDYAIQHQRTAPQWPQCNGMVERMIKTLKHGITVLAADPANVNCWDEHLAKVLFGYRCGVQASTKFSPFMILTGRSPRLRATTIWMFWPMRLMIPPVWRILQSSSWKRCSS